MIVAPSRGRGLKRNKLPLTKPIKEVAPSRGRGLKPSFARWRRRWGRSPLHGGVD